MNPSATSRDRLTAAQAAELVGTTEEEWVDLVLTRRAPAPDSGWTFPSALWWHRSTIDIWSARQALDQAHPAGSHQEITHALLGQITDLAAAGADSSYATQVRAQDEIHRIARDLLKEGALAAWTRALLQTEPTAGQIASARPSLCSDLNCGRPLADNPSPWCARTDAHRAPGIPSQAAS